jgi:cellulose synthase operon protein YhjQ
MDSRGIDKLDELPASDTPEDVAVLYSWANLHGAKYRDFSASRREYRAQLRHRAAEQIREQELKAQAEAEAAAVVADVAARQAESAAQSTQDKTSDSSRQQALREAGRASRIASAERVEAARRAEAAALAEAAARREEREIAEANASARRQAARYAESEIRNRESSIHRAAQVPGRMSDPYTLPEHPQSQPQQPLPLAPQRIDSHYEETAAIQRESPPLASYQVAPPVISPEPVKQAYTLPAAAQSSSQRRPQGYRPDDASGVREIYRGPEFDAPQAEYLAAEPVRHLKPFTNSLSPEVLPQDTRLKSAVDQSMHDQRPVPAQYAEPPLPSGPKIAHQPQSVRISYVEPAAAQEPLVQEVWPIPATEKLEPPPVPRATSRRDFLVASPSGASSQRGQDTVRGASPFQSTLQRVPSPFAPAPAEMPRGRRGQDDLGYQPPSAPVEPPRRSSSTGNKPATSSAQRLPYSAEPTGPAWLYAPQTPQPQPRHAGPTSNVNQSSVADTLQHSRERVAARWYALKGVFEQPGQDQPEVPIRQKETRTPVLAVFSLAGGVGKTSLVATLGRALSSLGEKVLLTDTTSHGLLPFYFGASELRQGVVRTFSPPSGSTDAPIYLLSYDVDQKCSDEESQSQLVDEISNNSKGTHRIILDLTPSSGWIARRMARMNPTILVPVAPDMNSVISLQTVEKYFHGAIDADGRPLEPYYVLNQFDASLPLHLDVREVLRRQLGDRLLPFVIRRAPAVSEALAEGMTVVDYAPETPISEDYQNVASWLRTIAAPATAGFRNVRWSER